MKLSDLIKETKLSDNPLEFWRENAEGVALALLLSPEELSEFLAKDPDKVALARVLKKAQGFAREAKGAARSRAFAEFSDYSVDGFRRLLSGPIPEFIRLGDADDAVCFHAGILKKVLAVADVMSIQVKERRLEILWGAHGRMRLRSAFKKTADFETIAPFPSNDA